MKNTINLFKKRISGLFSRVVDIDSEMEKVMRSSEKQTLHPATMHSIMILNQLSFSDKVDRMEDIKYESVGCFLIDTVKVNDTNNVVVAKLSPFSDTFESYKEPDLGDVVHTAFGWCVLVRKRKFGDSYILGLKAVSEDHIGKFSPGIKEYIRSFGVIYCILGGYKEIDYEG